MSGKGRSKQVLVGLLVLSTLVLFAGCAAKRASGQETEAGLILRYRMPESRTLSYRATTDFTQIMEIQGQSTEIKADTTLDYSVSPEGRSKDNHRLQVTIDGMEMAVTHPKGVITPNLDGVVGKSFGMTLSPLGKELELAGAHTLQYELAETEKHSLAMEFQEAFPDLPDGPVKIGDTWPTEWTISENIDGAEVEMTFNGVNTLEGFEEVDGLDCARIQMAFTGILEGNREVKGLNFATSGNIEGSATWYFAYKKGIFVKLVTAGTGDADILVSGKKTMTIPTTRSFKMETKLVS